MQEGVVAVDAGMVGILTIIAVTLVFILVKIIEGNGHGRRTADVAERVPPALKEISKRMPEPIPRDEKIAGYESVIDSQRRELEGAREKIAELEKRNETIVALLKPPRPAVPAEGPRA